MNRMAMFPPLLSPNLFHLPSDDSPTLHHLSLQAYHGTSGKCTIYFSGSIAGQAPPCVRILLDGGSSDNFIQMEKIPKRKSQSNRWVNNEWDRLDPTATHIGKCSADAS
jgi:hypothetical protein